VLGWGGGYGGEALGPILQAIDTAMPVMLDRWQVSVNLLDETEEAMPPKIFNNYFSIGVDAKVSLEFHEAREQNPSAFSSRVYNKYKYFQYGAESIFDGCPALCKQIDILIDGTPVVLPEASESLVILNLPSYASGTNPWPSKPETYGLKSQEIDDCLVEVVVLTGALHLAQLRTGTSSGIPLGQGRDITITVKKPLPVQADGEPWLQEPAIIELTHHSQVKMLRKALTMTKKQRLFQSITTSMNKSV